MAGGALGSGARYIVGIAAASKLPERFPYGTLIVNVTGSFAMGFVVALAGASTMISPEMRAFTTAGLLGGFTTYSSFNQETLAFVNAGAWGSAALYAGVTFGVCLLAGIAGMFAARSFVHG